MRNLGALLFALALGFGACSKDQANAPAKQEHGGHGHAQGTGGVHAGKVTVPKAGKRFKPPIPKSQLPDGVWYCDMGTVEYARGERGDGKCPVCGMTLKHKLAAK